MFQTADIEAIRQLIAVIGFFILIGMIIYGHLFRK